MAVVSSNPALCTVTEVTEASLPADDRATGASAAASGDRFFKLTGKAKGVCSLLASRIPFVPVELEVSVKDKLTQRVKFFSVSDNAGNRSTRPLAVTGQWLPVFNYIFRRQANIELVRHGSLESITIAQNLGNPIDLPTTGGLGTNATVIANRGDATADLNIFFVWELRRGTGDSTEATTQTIGSAHSGSSGNVLVEDNMDGRDDLIVAHEIGHHLGLSHNNTTKLNLMFDTTPFTGFSLNKAEVNTANP